MRRIYGSWKMTETVVWMAARTNASVDPLTQMGLETERLLRREKKPIPPKSPKRENMAEVKLVLLESLPWMTM